MRTTSGAQPRRLVDRLGAVGGLADDLDVGLGLEDHAEAGATSAWSSTIRTRTLMLRHAASGSSARSS